MTFYIFIILLLSYNGNKVDGNFELRSRQQIKVTPTTFWLKCKNLSKCTKFCSTRKLEVAAKNFGLLTKTRLMHWQIRGLKGSISGNFCVVCLNLSTQIFRLWHIATSWSSTISANDNQVNLGLKSFPFLSESINV